MRPIKRRKWIKQSDLVYYIEEYNDEDGKLRFRINQGYYLASYVTQGWNHFSCNIITDGDIRSDVVRHIDTELFHTYEEAERTLEYWKEKEKSDG